MGEWALEFHQKTATTLKGYAVFDWDEVGDMSMLAKHWEGSDRGL